MTLGVNLGITGSRVTLRTALTTAYGGIRYQDQSPNTGEGYKEFAVFIGLTHRFN